MAGRAASIGVDGRTSSVAASAGACTGATVPTAGHVTVTLLSSYAIAGADGGGGGGTSGTAIRAESGPLRPRVEVANATYVRVSSVGCGASNGRGVSSPSVVEAGAFGSFGTSTGVSISAVSGSSKRAGEP